MRPLHPVPNQQRRLPLNPRQKYLKSTMKSRRRKNHQRSLSLTTLQKKFYQVKSGCFMHVLCQRLVSHWPKTKTILLYILKIMQAISNFNYSKVSYYMNFKNINFTKILDMLDGLAYLLYTCMQVFIFLQIHEFQKHKFY